MEPFVIFWISDQVRCTRRILSPFFLTFFSAVDGVNSRSKGTVVVSVVVISGVGIVIVDSFT